LVAPAAIVVELPTTPQAVLLDNSVTVRPPAGAGWLIMIVPVELLPPVTVLGLRTSPVVPDAVRTSVPVCVLPLTVAVMWAVVLDVTPVVVTVKVAVVAPAGTLTVAGTVAEAVSEPRLTERPLVGAAELIVSVAVELTPPSTVVGFRVRAVAVGAVIASTVVGEVPFAVAVMVDVPFVATATVVTLNVAVVAPPATDTDAGTVTAALLEVNVTVKPAVGATEPSVTVPVEPSPPTTVVGLTETDATVGAVTARVVVAECVPKLVVVAVIVSLSFAATATVVTVNVVLLEPAGTVTDAGTVAFLLLDVRATGSAPPVETAPTSVTVPVEELPPATDVGVTDTADTNGGHTVALTVAFDPPLVAVIVTLVEGVTHTVLTTNCTLVLPAGTVTDAGTVASPVLDEANVAMKPPAGAGFARVNLA